VEAARLRAATRYALLCLLALDALLLRSLDLARWSVPLERALGVTLVVLFAGGVLVEAARLARWSAAMVALAALLALVQLALAHAVDPAGPGAGVALGTAYGPVTVWPAIEARALGLRLLATPGWLLLAAADGALGAVALSRLRGRSACALAGGGAVSLASCACPACAPPLASLVVALGGEATALLQPTGPWPTLAQLAPPLVTLAGLVAWDRPPARLARRASVATLAALAAWGLEPAGSVEQQRIDSLFGLFQVLGFAIAILFIGLVVYAAVRYRRGRQGPPAPPPGPGARRVWQTVWIGVPLIVLAVLCAASFVVLQEIEADPPATERIDVVAMQWGWEFKDANGTSSLDVLHVRADDEVQLNVTSSDVAHSLFVPDLGLNVNAIPGRVNEAHFRTLGPGEHQGYCAEFCGIGHPDMTLRVIVT
jgi:cytochrome c oxidase subunit 2